MAITRESTWQRAQCSICKCQSGNDLTATPPGLTEALRVAFRAKSLSGDYATGRKNRTSALFGGSGFVVIPSGAAPRRRRGIAILPLERPPGRDECDSSPPAFGLRSE